jgi:hypothetical protein
MADTQPPDDDWIVCLGETRAISVGTVACPRAGGRLMRVETCDDCHFLEWHSGERDAEPPCATADTPHYGSIERQGVPAHDDR